MGTWRKDVFLSFGFGVLFAVLGVLLSQWTGDWRIDFCFFLFFGVIGLFVIGYSVFTPYPIGRLGLFTKGAYREMYSKSQAKAALRERYALRTSLLAALFVIPNFVMPLFLNHWY